MKHKHSFPALLLLWVALWLVACGKKQSAFQLPEHSALIGLGTTFTLGPDSALLLLADYFPQGERPDSVRTGEGLNWAWRNDGKALALLVKDAAQLKPYDLLELKIEGYWYAIVLKKSDKIWRDYQFDAKGKDYAQVQLAGDFNNWQPASTPLSSENGFFKTRLLLNPGRYAYQLVLDGQWQLDPQNKDSVANGSGGFNSVLQVSEGDATLKPFIYPKSFGKNQIRLGLRGDLEQCLVLLDNHVLSAEQLYVKKDEIRIDLPPGLAQTEHVSLRVFPYNAQGRGNDLFIPLYRGAVVNQLTHLPSGDYRKSIMYFMMVDRFMDGDSTNNVRVNDPEVLPKANYYGGDLQGIIDRLRDGYFEELKINTIWISPISQNPWGAYREYPAPRRKFSGYHGYWPISSSKVDRRFGDEALLRTLIKEAHNRGIKVLLDFVSNHVHNEHPVYKQKPEWFNPLVLPDGRTNIRIWDEHRLTTWFDDFMPDINYEVPEAVEAFSDSALYWIKEFGIDGFRHDATKHVSEDFWRMLTKKLKQQVYRKRGEWVYQIGETFGSRELIASYIGSGQMDGQFDFNLYFDARDVFSGADPNFKRLVASLQETFAYYGHHHLMGNITGNHDLVRFITLAGDGLKPGEDEKEAGWQREIKVENPLGYARLKMLTAFLMSIPGIPITYYGDEIGMPGANDPDNRRMMQFTGLSPLEADVLASHKKVSALRASHLSLIYGTTEVLHAEARSLALMRRYFGDVVISLFNHSDKVKTIRLRLPDDLRGMPLKSLNGQAFTFANGDLEIALQPYSFDMLFTPEKEP